MSRLAKNCAQNRCIRSFTHQATCHQHSAQRTVRTAARELGILIAADLLELCSLVLGTSTCFKVFQLELFEFANKRFKLSCQHQSYLNIHRYSKKRSVYMILTYINYHCSTLCIIGDLNPSSIIAVFSRVDMRIMRIQVWHPTAQAVVLLLSCDELNPVKARSLWGFWARLSCPSLWTGHEKSCVCLCEVNDGINAFLWCLVKGVV